MRKVTGGNPPAGGGCETPYFLECKTPGGKEIWCRSSISGVATTVCRGIYPLYDPTDVTGEWGVTIVP